MITQKRRKKRHDDEYEDSLKIIIIVIIAAFVGVSSSFIILISSINTVKNGEDTLAQQVTTVEETEQIRRHVKETETIIEMETIKDTETEENSIKEFRDRCRLTYAESGLEDEMGQIAVAAVVLNREEAGEFPDTFYGVMNHDDAFSSVKDGEIYIMTLKPYILEYEDIPECTIEATQRALDGEDPTEALLYEEAIRLGLDPEKYATGGALFFYNPEACSLDELSEREDIKCKIRIGSHIFYKIWDHSTSQ